jgi:hypothetical protein
VLKAIRSWFIVGTAIILNLIFYVGALNEEKPELNPSPS